MNASMCVFALHELCSALGCLRISVWVFHTDTPMRICRFAELRERLGKGS